MGTLESKVFRSGNSQAVRIPKEVAFEDNIEVIIERVGNSLTIRPKKKISFDEMVKQLKALPKPKEKLRRLPVDIPKREGL